MPHEIFFLEMIDAAEDHGRIREQAVPILAQKVERVVVGGHDDIEAMGRELAGIYIGELDQRIVPIEPLGVHVFDIEIAGPQFRQQDRIDSPALIVGPAVSLVVGMQDQDALSGKVRQKWRADSGENEETGNTAEHGDLDAGTDGAACVFPLRRTSAIPDVNTYDCSPRRDGATGMKERKIKGKGREHRGDREHRERELRARRGAQWSGVSAGSLKLMSRSNLLPESLRYAGN